MNWLIKELQKFKLPKDKPEKPKKNIDDDWYRDRWGEDEEFFARYPGAGKTSWIRRRKVWRELV